MNPISLNHQTLLSAFKNLYPLGEEALELIQEITTTVIVKKGEIVQDIGQSCKNLYFIESGCLRIFYYKEGLDITESFEFEHSFVARGESLITMRPSNKGIEAVEDSRLFQINTPKLFALFQTNIDLERVFHRIIEQAYIQQLNRLESLQFLTAEARYEQLIVAQPQAIQRIPLKFIASYLGITQVSLSRIRAKK